MKSSQGFTLLSMLLVLAIVGLLSVIVLPSVMGVGREANLSRMKANLRSIRNALEHYYITYGEYPDQDFGAWDDPAQNALLAMNMRLLDRMPEDIYNPGHTYEYAVAFKGDKMAGNTERRRSIYVVSTTGPAQDGKVQFWNNREDYTTISKGAVEGYVTNAGTVEEKP